MKVALSIAGFDPSAGAGVLVDLKVFWRLGLYGLGISTCLTVQNSCRVGGVWPVPARCLTEQLQALTDDFSISCIKVGMVHNHETIRALADFFVRTGPEIIVLDPVWKAGVGAELTGSQDLSVLKDELLPLVHVLTPNVQEAEFLLGSPLISFLDAENAALDLSLRFGVDVVLKGGHWSGATGRDVACHQEEIRVFSAPPLDLPAVHGTGCVFSSALAGYLAKGEDFWLAVQQAKDFVRHFMEQARPLGHGSLLGMC